MSALVTILTFNYPHEAIVIRSRLEAEGIPCFIKDGFIAQVHPFYSTAVGGVKLQVQESDVPAAIQILKEAGYKPDEDTHSVKLHYFFEKIIPVFAKWRILAAILLVAASIAFIVNIYKPDTYEKITENGWCMDYVVFYNQRYEPYSYKCYLNSFCNKNIYFEYDGDLKLPGFNSKAIYGKWELLNDDEIKFFQSDTLGQIFDRVYSVKFDGDRLILWTPQTTIYCTKYETKYNK